MNKKKVSPPSTAAETADFESAVQQLERVVAALEEGNLGLTASLDQYEQGVQHLKRRYDLLEQAEARITILRGFDAEGNPVSESFEEEQRTLEQKAASRGAPPDGFRKKTEEKPERSGRFCRRRYSHAFLKLALPKANPVNSA